jgi:hypothetical protein
MAAKKKSRLTIFKQPGGSTIALDLNQATAIERHKDGETYVFFGGNRHVITTDEALSDLAGGAEEPEEAETE